jgi:hypothetical protein
VRPAFNLASNQSQHYRVRKSHICSNIERSCLRPVNKNSCEIAGLIRVRDRKKGRNR